MFGLESLRGALIGERPNLPPPGRDDPDEAAAILAQLEDKMPTLERGQAWLTRARSDVPLLEHHRQEVLATIPVLRTSATNGWINLMEAEGWEPELDSYSLVRLLAAMLAWQVAASQRALARFHIDSNGLSPLLWAPLVGECERYLVEQTASENVLRQWHHATDQVASLIDVALVAPGADESAIELVEATQGWCGIQDQAAAPDVLASQWRIMDVAALGFGIGRSVNSYNSRRGRAGCVTAAKPPSSSSNHIDVTFVVGPDKAATRRLRAMYSRLIVRTWHTQPNSGLVALTDNHRRAAAEGRFMQRQEQHEQAASFCICGRNVDVHASATLQLIK